MHKQIQALAYAHGLFSIKTGKPINMTLKPTKVDARLFKEIQSLQTDFHLLYYNLALDLESYKLEDELSIYLKSILSNKKKRIQALYLRSDYLLDQDDHNLVYKQVEINTISQCFSIFGPIVNRIHALFNNKTLVSSSDVKFIEFLKTIKQEYEKIHNTSNTVVVMVDNDTSPESSNFLEKMKIIELALKESITFYHVLINEIDFVEDKAFYKSQEIAIVYFRWFYNYEHYDSISKETRKKIEESEAVSLPSAAFQLINSKTFQEILSHDETLRKYTNKNIKKHFGEFKKPKDSNIPEGWILKDVGEGGGFLNGSPTKTSLLMKKFRSPMSLNAFLSDGKAREIISEISIFGGHISVEGEIVYNEEGGYMVRSKDKDSLEDGVCVGAGGLDSIVF